MFGGKELFQILILTMIQEFTQDINYCYTFYKKPNIKFHAITSNELINSESNNSKTIHAIEHDYCYAFDEDAYIKFGTRTAYEFVRGGENPYETIPRCKPIQIWMLIRHGTKYPGLKKIETMKNITIFRDEIVKNHEEHGYGRLCDEDLKNLKLWRLDPNLRLEAPETLTKQGVEDLNQLAKRIRKNLPQLFPPVMSDAGSANYKFHAADEARMDSSKIAFMSGLLDKVDISDAAEPINDSLFVSHYNCPMWVTEVANNLKFLEELQKFTSGPEYTNMISNISRRLGFLNNITRDSVHHMWSICRYEKAWRIRDLSPWCAVFSKRDLEVLEYVEDFKDYYKRGYGHEFNIRLGCPPLRNLFQSFTKLETGNYTSEPRGVFNFVSSGSLHLFMAAMGFAKDSTPPLASGFDSRNQRQWRTSEIGSFAANIAAIFYKCEDAGSPHKVVFYLAEKLVHYDGCENGICDWEYLKNKFPNATSDCNSDFCFRESPNIQSTTIS